MSSNSPRNLSASVKQRLLNRIRRTGEDANLVWSRYATERLLYRLSVSDYVGDFVLKGAALFIVWMGRFPRPTRDVDLLGCDESSPERIGRIFRSVCRVDVEPDGLRFDPETVSVEPIRANQEGGGHRVALTAYLGKARIPVRIDVAFGDAVTPGPEQVTYPTLLDFPAPRLRAHPRESTIAEKLHAMVELGIINSRMKDFYDLYVLAAEFPFDGAKLSAAVSATFQSRGTSVPAGLPLALTPEFGENASKQRQWTAFLRRSGVEDAPEGLSEVVAALAEFVGPVLRALSEGGRFEREWPPSGPWR